MNEPKLSLPEAQAVVATKTAPRVTEQSIKDKIASVDYIVRDMLLRFRHTDPTG